jgi:sugar/nucleoside kinase (ribokinase family)
LCTGIAVLDEVFRVERFPAADMKAMATEFTTVGGGCAANAAVAIARLGAKVGFAGPLGGPAGDEPTGDRILAGLVGEGVDCAGCVRVPGIASCLSAIMVNNIGQRTVVTYRDDRLLRARPEKPEQLVAAADAVAADNSFPEFSLPICQAARARGIPVVLDADKPTQVTDPLFTLASHVIFSTQCLRATADTEDLATGLARVSEHTPSFLSVTDGSNGVYWRDGSALRHMPAFAIKTVDTLAAGDVFHAGFVIALVEGCGITGAMRLAAAAAGIKCSRFGGSSTAPGRAEVEAFLANA